MKKRKIAIGVIIAFLIIVVAVSYSLGFFNSKNDKPIGGDTDSHGCLIGAGYSWDSEVGACTRPWELDAEKKAAAIEAVKPLSYPVTVIDVKKRDCEGCYNVSLQRTDTQYRFDVNVKIEKKFCSEEQKAGEFCIEIYAPVCGFLKNGTKQTFGNSCFACHEDIEYWIDGECQ